MRQPLIFGEVLYDCFPDKEVLGGAPFNVAWHLKGFGQDPLMLSRISENKHGKDVLSAMQKWGMNTSGIQIDELHPTGIVDIRMDGKNHSFEIKSEQAYDYINFKDYVESPESSLASVFSNAPLLYHGSLALRSEASNSSFIELSQSYELPRFLDLNLREPWWEKDQLPKLLQDASWVKLNDEELEIAFGMISKVPANTLEEQAEAVKTHFSIDTIIVTKGEDGAFLLDGANKLIVGKAAPAANVVDTVGAGDAFASVVLLGILSGWAPSRFMSYATEFASSIVGMRGATCSDESVYNDFISRWSHNE
jgi:fructokinase